jgi:hypothetical protein
MKTAVEIIREHFYTYAEPYNGFSEEPKWTISEEDFEKLIQQAKEMEKNQIINAYLKSKRKRTDLLGALKIMDEAEQYYNETFKSE